MATGYTPVQHRNSPEQKTPHKAGIIGEAKVPATARTTVAVSPECRGAAAADGAHDLQLGPCHVRLIVIQETVAGCAEDVGHLQDGPGHDAEDSVPDTPARGRVSRGFGAPRSFRMDR